MNNNHNQASDGEAKAKPEVTCVAKNPEVRAKVRAVAALSNVELLPR